jgi:hypothetical protein
MMAVAGGDLYHGSAGMALFLAELWHITNDRSTLTCAEAALRFSIAQRDSGTVRSAGLYCGEAGVAYVAWRFSQILRSEQWAIEAHKIVSDFPPRATQMRPLDIISGDAGLILGLLRMRREHDSEQALQLALDAGARLVESAVRRPFGWSWNTGSRGAQQDLCGYAHGVSGIAHAFLELFAHTGDREWSFAARRALAYERHHRLHTLSDWPDFRSAKLSIILADPGGASLLQQRLRSGEPAPTSAAPTMRAWCHGSPGIALTRIRAIMLGIDIDDCAQEVRASVDVLREDLRRPSVRGYSLCHGTFGNAETILAAEQRLGYSPTAQIHQVAHIAVDSYERTGARWPSGLSSQEAEPSLMLGEAGIGHFLLRLVDPSIPSVLFLSDWRRGLKAVADEATLRRAEIGVLLPTLDPFLNKRGASAGFATRLVALASPSTSIENAVESLAQISRMPGDDPDRIQFADALMPDFERIREQLAFTDFSAQFCFELQQPRLADIDWASARFVRAPSTRLVRTRWAWQAWLCASDGELLEQPETFMVWRERREVLVVPTTAVGTLVIESLTEPRSIADVCALLKQQVEISEPRSEALPRFIRKTLQRAVAMHAVLAFHRTSPV